MLRFYHTYFSFVGADLSLPSLPTSEVALDGLVLACPDPPSSPRRMIFFGNSCGGVALALLVVLFPTILAKDGGTRQNGVRKMRTDPWTASKECVM